MRGRSARLHSGEYSSLYDAIQEAKRKGKSLAGGSITLAIPVSGDYRIR